MYRLCASYSKLSRIQHRRNTRRMRLSQPRSRGNCAIPLPHAKRLKSACETVRFRIRNGSIPHAKRLIFRMRNARFVCDPKYVNEYVRMRSHAFRMRVVCESHANRIKIFHRACTCRKKVFDKMISPTS